MYLSRRIFLQSLYSRYFVAVNSSVLSSFYLFPSCDVGATDTILVLFSEYCAFVDFSVVLSDIVTQLQDRAVYLYYDSV